MNACVGGAVEQHGSPVAHVFVAGTDYHLGDLLWLTAVLAEYRRRIRPDLLILACPDRPISHVMEKNPLLDGLLYGDPQEVLARLQILYRDRLVVRDLRPLALARAMLRDWRYRPPWLYYRDLWWQERGQWLATFLHLGRLHDFRPIMGICEEDRAIARTLNRPYVLLAPHIGQYRWSWMAAVWRHLKQWPWASWRRLALLLREAGYEPITLAASDQASIPETTALLGLPIRQVAGVIEGATALVSGESGLWFMAAACGTPFLIVPWWLPRSVNWAAPMHVPHRLIHDGTTPSQVVFNDLTEMIADER